MKYKQRIEMGDVSVKAAVCLPPAPGTHCSPTTVQLRVCYCSVSKSSEVVRHRSELWAITALRTLSGSWHSREPVHRTPLPTAGQAQPLIAQCMRNSQGPLTLHPEPQSLGHRNGQVEGSA